MRNIGTMALCWGTMLVHEVLHEHCHFDLTHYLIMGDVKVLGYQHF